jgi:hypothetical protein
LKELKIKLNGTIRTNRKCLCDEVIIRKAEETQLKKTPGYFRFASFLDMLFMSWFDKRGVAILSNAYPAPGDYVVQHWYPAKAGEPASVNGKIQKRSPYSCSATRPEPCIGAGSAMHHYALQNQSALSYSIPNEFRALICT